MTYLIILILLTESVKSEATILNDRKQDNDGLATELKQTENPDLELLMFLGAWDDDENDQWLDPEIFSEDSQINQQLDDDKVTNNEQDPDHN
ncbi:MAG: hypothetical protein ACSHWU_03850 [Marinicella sp.]